jgi:hypothetical protein
MSCLRIRNGSWPRPTSILSPLIPASGLPAGRFFIPSEAALPSCLDFLTYVLFLLALMLLSAFTIFYERAPAFSDPAHDRQDDPALVWRLGRGLDNRHAFLPDGAPRRLPLRSLVGPHTRAERPGNRPCCASRPEPSAPARDAVSCREAVGQRGPGPAHPGPSRGIRGASLFFALHDEPAHPGLVREETSDRSAVPILRALQRGIAPGVLGLSVSYRAERHPAAAISWLVRRYGIFVLFGAVAAFAGSRTDAPQACTGSDAGDANAGYRPPRMQEQLFWMLLAACSSTMLDTLTCQ